MKTGYILITLCLSRAVMRHRFRVNRTAACSKRISSKKAGLLFFIFFLLFLFFLFLTLGYVLIDFIWRYSPLSSRLIVRLCVCVRAWVRACVRACVRVCVSYIYYVLSIKKKNVLFSSLYEYICLSKKKIYIYA